VLLGGGETTVTVRGAGVGGRNTEFALAAALALADVPDAGWVVASLATDGQDALTGVAGAVADGGTVARAATAGVDARRALADNDSLRVFEVAGGLIRPGPTGTNVNDLYVALRVRSK
jgi:glycerate 2-kinase